MNGANLREKNNKGFTTKPDLFLIGISIILSLVVVFMFPNVDAKDRFLSFLLFFLGFFGFTYSVVPIFTGKYGWWIDIPFLIGNCKKAESPLLFWSGVLLRFLVSGFVLYVAIKLTFLY